MTAEAALVPWARVTASLGLRWPIPLSEAPDAVGVDSRDGDLVAPDQNLGVAERRLDEAEQLVPVAEEAHHETVVGDENLDLGRRHW